MGDNPQNNSPPLDSPPHNNAQQLSQDAPGTCHPLDDEWYMYEATNGMKFNLPKRYKVKEELGTGSYAAVLSADDLVTGETIAIKRCDQLFRHPEDGKRVLREIKLLQFFDHPNLVRIRGLLPPRSPSFLDVYILTEFLDMDLKPQGVFLPCTTVFHLSHQELLLTVGPLDEESSQSILYQTVCGLNYIHSAEVIHRDLKPDNILLNIKNNDIVAKICDFNLSRQMQRRDMTREVVSAAYRPPELLLQTKAGYNSAVDLWSLGCILYEMVTAKQLFPGKKPKHTLCRVLTTIPLPPFAELDWLTHESQTFLRKNCPPLRTTVSTKLHGRMTSTGISLVVKLLTVEPAKRPTAAEVLKHPYLRKLQNPANEACASKKFAWPSDRVNLSASRLRTMFWQEMLGSPESLDPPGQCLPPTGARSRSPGLPPASRSVSPGLNGVDLHRAPSVSVGDPTLSATSPHPRAGVQVLYASSPHLHGKRHEPPPSPGAQPPPSPKEAGSGPATPKTPKQANVEAEDGLEPPPAPRSRTRPLELRASPPRPVNVPLRNGSTSGAPAVRSRSPPMSTAAPPSHRTTGAGGHYGAPPDRAPRPTPRTATRSSSSGLALANTTGVRSRSPENPDNTAPAPRTTGTRMTVSYANAPSARLTSASRAHTVTRASPIPVPPTSSHPSQMGQHSPPRSLFQRQHAPTVLSLPAQPQSQTLRSASQPLQLRGGYGSGTTYPMTRKPPAPVPKPVTAHRTTPTTTTAPFSSTMARRSSSQPKREVGVTRTPAAAVPTATAGHAARSRSKPNTMGQHT